MIRVARAIALLLLVIPAANAQAANLTLKFAGTVKAVVDANSQGLPPIDFDPIPIGSAFSATIAYDTDSPPTDGGTGYTRYLNLLSSSSSLTVNGHNFATTAPVSAIVVSEEANFGFSGVNLVNQPLTLPADWSVAHSPSPYFTLQLWDAEPLTRSLALPSSADEFPTDVMNLILDFQQPVTVAGQTYGGRVYITFNITSLSVGPPPPQEVVIDVDPFSVENRVNLSGKKLKPLQVAVFGEVDFDILSVLPETIRLGDPVLTDPDIGTGDKVAPKSMSYEDVDGDGELDLFLVFDLAVMLNAGAIDQLSQSLEFEGVLDNDGIVYGSDFVSTGGKGKGGGRK